MTATRNDQKLLKSNLAEQGPSTHDTTIYELEQKGEFPKRLYLTPRCVVWPLNEILNRLDERKAASERGEIDLAPAPDVRLRASRPVTEGIRH